MDKLTLNICC